MLILAAGKCRQSRRAPNAIRSGGERNLIGLRTQPDRAAYAIGRSPLIFIYENGK